jgi:hypothetical protein
MISAATIAGLAARGLDYTLGAREHTDKLVRQIVLDDQTPFVPLAIARRQGATQLFVKQVKHAGVPYIVCRNESEGSAAAAPKCQRRQNRRGPSATTMPNSAISRVAH